MNTSDAIKALFDANVVELSILKNPKENTICIQAKQFVVTGPDGNRVNAVVQVEADSLATALNKLRQNADHLNELQTRIVQVKTGHN